MTTDNAFEPDIRWMLRIGTVALIIGLILFALGTKAAYLNAVTPTTPGNTAVFGMLAYLFVGLLTAILGTGLCFQAVEEQTQVDLIKRNAEREAELREQIP